jgi:Lecithin retinol acyltransferase
MMMTLTQFISANNLRPADAVELVCPDAGFPKHYAVYLGYSNGTPKFIANITDGVQILSHERLSEFVQKYQVTNIERFAGNHQQRLAAVKRAIKRVGERAYNLIFNNCEHFKNWVLNGEGISKQAVSIGTGIAAVGATGYLLGMALESKGLKKAGGVILIILLVVISIAFVMWQYKQSSDNNSLRDND